MWIGVLALWMNNHIMIEKCEVCSKNNSVPSCGKSKSFFKDQEKKYKEWIEK